MLHDLLAVVLFFIAYKFYDIFIATSVIMAVVTLQVIWQRVTQQKVNPFLFTSWLLLLIMGATTLVFHQESFIQWKPSVLYLLLGGALWGSQHLGSKIPLLQRLLGEKVALSTEHWRKLSYYWTLFFSSMAVLNAYVVLHFPLSTWVHFKLFGCLGLTLLFLIGQSIYLFKHQTTELSS